MFWRKWKQKHKLSKFVAGLSRKGIALSTHIRNEKWPEIKNLTFYLRKLEREKQVKCKGSRIKERNREKINKIQNRKRIEKIK